MSYSLPDRTKLVSVQLQGEQLYPEPFQKGSEGDCSCQPPGQLHCRKTRESAGVGCKQPKPQVEFYVI